MKQYKWLLVAPLLLSISINAQEVKTDNKKTNKIDGTEKVDSPQTVGDKVKIKDGTTTLIEIANEGSAGSIILPSVGSVLSGSKLYSNGVNLFWGNSQLNGSNGATKINDLSDAKSDSDGSDDGSSLFLGVEAGLNDDGNNNRNVGVGFHALYSNTTGWTNTAVGVFALSFNTTGGSNTAIGSQALANNSTGSNNTANGHSALQSNKAGNRGVAVGYQSQRYANNTTTSYDNNNTSVGYQSLMGSTNPANNTGSTNTAFGYQSLFSNETGNKNTANGSFTLYDNTTGNDNTATGYLALRFSETGNNNTANGSNALRFNMSGSNNTANGYSALLSNLTGIRNTASGSEALYRNIQGNYNTATGYKALYNNSSGSWNTAIGRQALEDQTTGNNNIGIGYDAQVPETAGSHQVRIGNTEIQYAGIQKAWSITSDKIWKEQIRVLPHGLDMVMRLKPVDYVRKNSDTKSREMGFIAQDIEETLTNINYSDQGFLTKDDEGRFNLRYNDFIALLTKAIQEQQNLINGQGNMIIELQNEIDELKRR